jgi:hypothetical protein
MRILSKHKLVRAEQRVKLQCLQVSVRVLAVLAGPRSSSTTQRHIEVNDQQLRNAVELA